MSRKYWYEEEIRHNGLNKYKVIKADSKYELQRKADALKAQWNEQWNRKCVAEEKKAAREKMLKSHEESLEFAAELTRNAEKDQEMLDAVLLNSLHPMPLDINKKKDFSDFPTQPPKQPSALVVPKEPQRTDIVYNPKIPLFTKLSRRKLEAFKNLFDSKFNNDHIDWEAKRKNRELEHDKDVKEYNIKFEQWEIERDAYKEEQSRMNASIDKFADDLPPVFAQLEC